MLNNRQKETTHLENVFFLLLPIEFSVRRRYQTWKDTREENIKYECRSLTRQWKPIISVLMDQYSDNCEAI